MSDEQSPSSTTPGFWRRAGVFLISRFFVSSLLGIAFLVSLLLSVAPAIDPDIRHVLMVVTVLLAIHLLDLLVISRENARITRELFESVLDRRAQGLRSMGKEIADEAIGRDLWKIHGIESVFGSRDEVVDQVLAEMRAAKERISLSGIALMDDVRLGAVIELLSSKIEEGVDVRLLMLDPLHSPALFRTLLKERPEALHRFKSNNRPPDRKPPTGYFDSEIYNMFKSAKGILSTHEDDFGSRSRFYSHLPGFWLAIADGHAYMQSYAYGTVVSTSTRRFAEMPVLKFARRPSGGMFEALVAHFENLWLTSDVDLFHMRARAEDAEQILDGIYERGNKWIDHAIHVRTNEDRRDSVRQRCRAASLELSLMDEGGNATPISKVLDTSVSGLGVLVQDCQHLEMGTLVRLGGAGLPAARGAVSLLVHMLQEEKHGGFVVARLNRPEPDSERTVVGLQRAAPERFNSWSLKPGA